MLFNVAIICTSKDCCYLRGSVNLNMDGLISDILDRKITYDNLVNSKVN